jgi:hypothetical protein
MVDYKYWDDLRRNIREKIGEFCVQDVTEAARSQVQDLSWGDVRNECARVDVAKSDIEGLITSAGRTAIDAYLNNSWGLYIW